MYKLGWFQAEMVDKVDWIAGGKSFTPSCATAPLENPAQVFKKIFIYPKFRLWPKWVSQAMERGSFLQGEVQSMLKWEGEELITNWKSLSASN